MKYFIPGFLVVAALILLAIGCGIFFAPHASHGANGIMLDTDPSLLSEVRAPGALLATMGVVILFGAWRQERAAAALGLVVLVYGSFGFARLFAWWVDGRPADGLVVAIYIELLLAATALVLRRLQPVSTP